MLDGINHDTLYKNPIESLFPISLEEVQVYAHTKLILNKGLNSKHLDKKSL
jgi:hypothetical protein